MICTCIKYPIPGLVHIFLSTISSIFESSVKAVTNSKMSSVANICDSFRI